MLIFDRIVLVVAMDFDQTQAIDDYEEEEEEQVEKDKAYPKKKEVILKKTQLKLTAAV